METINDTMEIIEQNLMFGKKNTVKRTKLSELTGLSDRSVRHLIEKLRRKTKDYVIVSTSSEPGYYKTDNPEEIREYMREQASRAKTIFYNLRNAHRILKGYDANAGFELDFNNIFKELNKM